MLYEDLKSKPKALYPPSFLSMSISVKVDNPQDKFSPQNRDVLEKPNSRDDVGLKPKRKPKNFGSGIDLLLSSSPSITERSHGPIHFSKADSNGSEKFLSIERPLIGLAFEERTKLLPQPGPHQFFLEPSVNE